MQEIDLLQLISKLGKIKIKITVADQWEPKHDPSLVNSILLANVLMITLIKNWANKKMHRESKQMGMHI